MSSQTQPQKVHVAFLTMLRVMWRFAFHFTVWNGSAPRLTRPIPKMFDFDLLYVTKCWLRCKSLDGVKYIPSANPSGYQSQLDLRNIDNLNIAPNVLSKKSSNDLARAIAPFTIPEPYSLND